MTIQEGDRFGTDVRSILVSGIDRDTVLVSLEAKVDGEWSLQECRWTYLADLERDLEARGFERVT